VVEEHNRINLTSDAVTRDSSWVKKYEPVSFFDLLTDEKHNREVLEWMKSWDPIVFHRAVRKLETTPSLFNKAAVKSNYSRPAEGYNFKKLILLAGPPGCGKTTLARVLARKCGYHYEEINASDDRSGKTLISKIDNLVSNRTIRK
jgi:chromosome transmission fidelity protein 18